MRRQHCGDLDAGTSTAAGVRGPGHTRETPRHAWPPSSPGGRPVNGTGTPDAGSRATPLSAEATAVPVHPRRADLLERRVRAAPHREVIDSMDSNTRGTRRRRVSSQVANGLAQESAVASNQVVAAQVLHRNHGEVRADRLLAG